MDDHNTTHEVVVPKKFNLNMIRALHPITNLQGKEKKNSEARETCSVAPWEYSQQNTDSGQMSDFLSFFFWPCRRTWGILVPRQGIQPMPPASENVESYTVDRQGSS